MLCALSIKRSNRRAYSRVIPPRTPPPKIVLTSPVPRGTADLLRRNNLGNAFFISLRYVNNRPNYCSSMCQILFHGASHPRIACG